ncbi:MAG: transposase, partial [Clostridiaceae bacterium]
QCAERYLSLLYDRLHKEIYNCPVLQADETPVCVSKDGRSAGAKSYMCYVLSLLPRIRVQKHLLYQRVS